LSTAVWETVGIVTFRFTSVAPFSRPCMSRQVNATETPSCSGPKTELISPVRIRSATALPAMVRSVSPRSIPASAAGLPGKTWARRSSVGPVAL